MSHQFYKPAKSRLQRSELAVPGSSPKMFEKAFTSAADYIFLDYTLSFAPPIHYHFESNNKVNLQLTDINGKIHINEKNLVSQGSFFPLKELLTGIYIVTIDNGSNRILTKFNVVQ